MAIWLGSAGGVRIGRTQTGRQYAHVDPSDVDAGAKRFGFGESTLALVTGDRVWIRRVDEQGALAAGLLDFVGPSGWLDGQRHGDGSWYVNADSLGGLRLYHSWSDAIAGGPAKAIALTVPAGRYRISYETEKDTVDCLAQTIGWTLNTDREVADYTSLGDGFKQQMATLVSGSGELDCFFDTFRRGGLPCSGDEDYEAPIYLHQLALRQQVGASFVGVFLLKRAGAVPLDVLLSAEEAGRELFYAAECVITGVATELVPDQPIHSKISFVTTGPIQLLFDYPKGYLLQEQPPNDKVLQESGFGILLETPD